MAYRPRYTTVFDGCSFHVTWQCHDKKWLIAEEWQKELYYDLLLKYKDEYGIQFHSYHLMENHPHLIGTMATREAFSNFFRVVNNLFARGVNKRLKQRGQVVMDRFKSPRIQNDIHMLGTMTYSDLNGVRCNRDKCPEDAKWSSYAYYAYGDDDPLITPAPSYLALGNTDEERQKAYREMVAALMLKDKINISDTCFIGDPDWVKEQYEILMEEMRKRRIAKQERQLKQNQIQDYSGP